MNVNDEKKQSMTFMKGVCGIAAVILAALLLLIGSFIYVTRYRITDIDTATSEDGQYEVIYQAVGEPDWPFGYSHVRLVLKRGQEIITKYKFDVANDGGSPSAEQWSVGWKDDHVEALVTGEEQPDRLYTLFYNGITEWKELDTQSGEWR